MASTRSIVAECPACGHEQGVPTVESANAARWPVLRDRVLDGSFQRHRCGSCGEAWRVEHPVLYTDLDRGQFIGLFPGNDRPDHARLGRLVEEAFQGVAGESAEAPARALGRGVVRRVVFGFEELREKVVALSAALDDRVVEALKIGTGQTGLVLHAVDDESLWFVHTPIPVHHPDEALLTRVPRAAYAALAAATATWAPTLPPLFAGPYVNARTCTGGLLPAPGEP